MVLPDFAIIGAQKAGSTALMRHLGDHPDLYLPPHESRYFRDPWFQFQTPAHLEQDLDGAPPGVARRGMKCPDLLAGEDAPRRVWDLLGPIPLIAVLREPVSRAMSAFYWGMQWGWIPLTDPATGLMRLLAGGYADVAPRAQEVLEYGLYGKHLARWCDVFGDAALFVATDEELRHETAGTLRRVFAHLDVDADVPLGGATKSVNTGVYSMRRLRLLQLRHRHILREFPGFEGRYLQPAQGAWGRSVNRSISALDRLVLARIVDNDRPAIPAYVTHALADYYRDDLTLLEQVTGKDHAAWRSRW